MSIKKISFFLYADKISSKLDRKMEETNGSIFENIVKHLRLSEKKFKQGNYKGALKDKIKVNALLKSKSCDKKTIEKYREELSILYSSRFDLIFDHKLKINELKKNEIVKMLETKSEEKLKNLDYKGAIKALRRAEKYLSN